MIQKAFAEKVIHTIQHKPNVLGLAAGGSWITQELDEYSDVDLVLVTQTRLSDDKQKMTALAAGFGELLNAFTGEHVGEPRVLICMYNDPLLHVDIKFVTLEEFKDRVEDPVVLWEQNRALTNLIKTHPGVWPPLNFQWIEDRFWTWLHYGALKIGRGEYFETLELLSFLRRTVIAPLLQIQNGKLPRALRKVEFNFKPRDLDELKTTVAAYEIQSIIQALENTVSLYVALRKSLYPPTVLLNERLREASYAYFMNVKTKVFTKTPPNL